MALKIIAECIVCDACLPECPNGAIYVPGDCWTIGEGTSVKEIYQLKDGSATSASEPHQPLSMDIYYIVPDKCTECQGFHEEPQCAAVCPVDVCVPDEAHPESVTELLHKQQSLHGQ